MDTDFIWICEACSEPVADEDGYIHAAVYNGQADARRKQIERFKADHRIASVQQILDGPQPISWQVHHSICDPDPANDDYFFDVARARTALQLLDWSLHLSQKNFYTVTDWPAFVYDKQNSVIWALA